jgi:hypothetical protein
VYSVRDIGPCSGRTAQIVERSPFDFLAAFRLDLDTARTNLCAAQ